MRLKPDARYDSSGPTKCVRWCWACLHPEEITCVFGRLELGNGRATVACRVRGLGAMRDTERHDPPQICHGSLVSKGRR